MSESDLNKILLERFDKIESKIDTLSDAMISLARAEEKIMSMESDRANMYERLNRHSEKIDELNDEVKKNSAITSNVVKITWLVIGSIIAGAMKIFSMGG